MNLVWEEMAAWLYVASTWALPLLLAITLHEAAHGFAALLFGDDTAKRMGRVSANPLRHVDPFGTIILPALLLVVRAPFLFGWAKPVPVDFARLRPFRAGMVLTAFAGPGTNLALAIVSGLLAHLTVLLPPGWNDWALDNCYNSIRINLILAVFNMIPLPPLDGGRVAVGLLPASLAIPLSRMERFGIPLLLGLLFLLPMAGVDVFPYLIGVPVQYLGTMVLWLTGLY